MTQRLTWSESFSVGHSTLDSEHFSIMEMIEHIGQKPLNDLPAALLDLEPAVEQHFTHENVILQMIMDEISNKQSTPRLIEVMGRAVISEHIVEHAREIESLRASIRGAHITKDGQSRLYDGLVHWFVTHAIRYDAHLKAVFQALKNDRPDLLTRLSAPI
jgi:hemerythrin